MKALKPILLAVAVAAAAGGLAWYWHEGTIHPSTDDAYVEANVLTISPLVSARVVEVLTDEGARVQAGDVLVRLDDSALSAAVAAAQAQLDLAYQQIEAASSQVDVATSALTAAQAAYSNADASFQRTQRLFNRNDVSQAALDTARAAHDEAEARVTQAEAALRAAEAALGAPGAENAAVRAAQAALSQAQIALDHATITAPAEGWIANISLRPGDVVAPGQSLFALVEDGTWWVDANFRETDLGRIRLGQPVEISIDMYPGLVLTGQVQTIGAGSGAVFALLPAQNATGNWVKVTQRFPVRIALEPPSDPAFQLRVGASATATVDTTQPGAAQ